MVATASQPVFLGPDLPKADRVTPPDLDARLTRKILLDPVIDLLLPKAVDKGHRPGLSASAEQLPLISKECRRPGAADAHLVAVSDDSWGVAAGCPTRRLASCREVRSSSSNSINKRRSTMVKSYRYAVIATLAIATVASAQDDPGSLGWQVPIPKVVPSLSRPVSGVGVWRYDQALRRYYEAISIQNEAEIRKAQADVDAYWADERERKEAQRQERLEEDRDKLQAREDRKYVRARLLWKEIEDGQVEWPLAFQSQWVKEQLELVARALRDRYTVGAARSALKEIRSALRDGRLTSSAIERDRAFRVLVLLEKIASDVDDYLVARR